MRLNLWRIAFPVFSGKSPAEHFAINLLFFDMQLACAAALRLIVVSVHNCSFCIVFVIEDVLRDKTAFVAN